MNEQTNGKTKTIYYINVGGINTAVVRAIIFQQNKYMYSHDNSYISYCLFIPSRAVPGFFD